MNSSVPRTYQRPPLPSQAVAEFEKAQAFLTASNLPLTVEVGCGVGLHPILWSKENSEGRLLAFERTQEKYKKAIGRYINNGSPQHVHIVHGDAAVLLPHLITGSCVSQYIFLYPNPYPKSKHTNLRLGQSPFLHFIHDSLILGGTLLCATNIAQYANEMKASLPTLGFNLVSENVISPNERPRSHFEKKYLARGETCVNLIFIKE